ncbi:PREDICTED: chondroitin sulfate proteoglycan 4 [Chrysochloris asiatica]|uniref:Chondroitin sulfate proteoglycan 4 n=1 Tax=Chrysochloris asiatica TaxID=185453 RepID=A0A9B0WQT3_CHRAS|nr:PREDICTED: chondroitin sulfate proteoglycan 4 [Chrysochloris asiatica]
MRSSPRPPPPAPALALVLTLAVLVNPTSAVEPPQHLRGSVHSVRLLLPRDHNDSGEQVYVGLVDLSPATSHLPPALSSLSLYRTPLMTDVTTSSLWDIPEHPSGQELRGTPTCRPKGTITVLSITLDHKLGIGEPSPTHPPLKHQLLPGKSQSHDHSFLLHTASFFGENHLEVPVAMALTDIHLQLQFSTPQPEALLLLAAGPADHLLLQLHDGHLQVRLVLGHEELRLQTPAEMLLSDSIPHTVVLTVVDKLATLSVDGQLNISALAPGTSLEVPYGLFLGGTGSLSLPYLKGTSRPLRGCFHTATLNGRSLLRPLTPDVHEGCAEEFSVGDDVALGFLGPHSLATFPAWGTRDEGTLEFTLTTQSQQAPLAFQAGGRRGDFIYVDIFKGHLRAMVEKGQGTVLLHNSVPVADGQPHEVSIHIDVHQLEISVDQYPTRTSNRGILSYLEPHGSLLLGGLDVEASRLLQEHRLGLAPSTVNASLLGCMEDLSVNGQRWGLRDALLTRNMAAGCRMEEEEYEEDTYGPYEAFSTLAPESWPTILLPEPCMPEPGLPAIFANFTQLLTISPLVVAEGGTAWLEWRHVQPSLDLSEAELRKSQVLFSVSRGARHGELELDIPGAQARKMFTLLDVVNRKARFIHDGSEDTSDQLVLEVSVTTRAMVPSCLRRGQTYILPIQVNPVNDPPRIVFPHGSLMMILENTQKPLGPEVFQAYDPDSACEGLTFQLLGNPTGLPVERRDQPGQPAAEFSCLELETGNLVYIHRGGPAQDLTFRVSDGLQASPPATLKVVAVRPAIQIRHNTGLHLAQGSAAPILPANLSVETNAVGQAVSVLFRVTGALQFGELQKQGAGGAEGTEWRAVQAFHQRDIEQGRVRYLSTDPKHRTEDAMENLGLEVQVGQETLSNFSFAVTIQRATVWLLRLEPLDALNTRQETLTTAHLEATLEGAGPSPTSFHYEVVQAPRKGNLRLKGTRLSDGQGFTQDDLQAGWVTYGATTRASEAVEDTFRFRVTAPPHFSPLYTFSIHIGGDPNAPVLTNVLLSVPEGGEGIISADHLFVKSLNSASYLYEVMERPRHGQLAWRDTQDKGTVVMSFTNEDLLRGRLVYRHDNSETTEDDIPFVATRQGEGSGGTASEEVRGVFRVAIQPVNDHAPVQTISHVFHVARGGQRLLTTDDVAFSDSDSGFADDQLVLTRKDLLFGSIVAVDEPTRPIYRFTQEDLRKRRVLFVHSGADRGWIQLQVSDGQHQATALLEVQASEPYLRVANGSNLVVPQGGQGTIDTAVLHLDTNLDIRSEDEIRYHVTSGPRWGQLLRAGQPVTVFSQQDLLSGVILYSHNGSLSARDTLAFSVEAGSVQTDATLQVTIALEGPVPPLHLVQHKKIYVFQGEAAEIRREQLEAAQEAVAPADIVFSVKTPPQAGYLVMVSHGASADLPPSLDPVQSFSQEAVDAGQVLYLHSRPEAWRDVFSLDVASSLGATLEDIHMELEVLPATIPLETQNFSVPEGGSRTLAPPLLHITGPYFPMLLGLKLQVLEAPQHGTLQREEEPQDQTLWAFSWREVQQQLIRYVHDGSETLTDSFVLVANASEIDRQSRPAVFTITVVPVNDQPPVLTTNTGLQIWEGATAPIPPEALRGTDRDSKPEDLVYTIEQPINGRLMLRAADTEVHSFTQAQVDNGLVLFTHRGALDGGFHFSLSDGEHTSPGHFFRVVARKQPRLTLEGSRTLTICPGSIQPLSSHNLKASSSEGTDPHHLRYHVVGGPQLGRLFHAQQGSTGDALVNFTQAEVSAGHVLYEHEMPPEPFWEAHDTLELLLSSPPAPDMVATFTVTVSFEAACPQRSSRLWRNKGLWVPEGQRAEITVTALDASNLLASIPSPQRPKHDVLFQVTQFPTRGQLLVSGEPLHAGRPHFLQSELATGQLEYAHGGGGSQQDSFHFHAHLQGPAGASVAGPQTSEAFIITVRDVNERPPQPQASVPLRLTRGSRAPISRAQLSVVDPDSAPGEIEYQVQRAPHNGFLNLAGGSPGPVTHFTQADVDAGRLTFMANGSSVAGIFQLSVSDGASPPLSMSLAVDVLPSAIEVQLRAPLEVPQALGRASLSRQQLQVVSDREEPDAAYRLIQGPQYGHLLVGGQPASAFSQLQIDQGQVVFAFTNFSSAHDYFSVLAQARGANASAVVNITVRALLHVWAGGPWPQGATLRLDPAVLDAAELANLTRSVPRFRLLAGPQHGRVVRVPRASMEPRDGQLVEQFTQKDLEDGRLGLEVGRPPDPAGTGDSLTLELWAQGVPPAVASLDFATEPYNAARPYSVALLSLPEAAQTEAAEKPENSSPTSYLGPAASSPVPTEARGGFLSFLEANMFSVIIPVCLVLLLLALILPLLFYLRKRNKTGKHNVQILTAKPRNGLAGDSETFRKVEPGQAIPLTAVPGQGPPPGSQPDPELLQFCRTPNPALKNGQYWV